MYGVNLNTIYECANFLLDVDGTLGLADQKMLDGRISSYASLDDAIQYFCLENNLNPRCMNIWGIEGVSTDFDRIQEWGILNGLNLTEEQVSTIIGYRIRFYEPDFSLFPDTLPGLQSVKALGGRSYIWTGNPKNESGEPEESIAYKKARDLIEAGFIEKTPMFTGERQTKATLLATAGNVLQSTKRLIVVGDTISDVNQSEQASAVYPRLTYLHRIGPHNRSEAILPNTNDPFDVAPFFVIDDPLFRLGVLGSRRMSEIMQSFNFRELKAMSLLIYNLDVTKPDLGSQITQWLGLLRETSDKHIFTFSRDVEAFVGLLFDGAQVANYMDGFNESDDKWLLRRNLNDFYKATMYDVIFNFAQHHIVDLSKSLFILAAESAHAAELYCYSKRYQEISNILKCHGYDKQFLAALGRSHTLALQSA